MCEYSLYMFVEYCESNVMSDDCGEKWCLSESVTIAQAEKHSARQGAVLSTCDPKCWCAHDEFSCLGFIWIIVFVLWYVSPSGGLAFPTSNSFCHALEHIPAKNNQRQWQCLGTVRMEQSEIKWVKNSKDMYGNVWGACVRQAFTLFGLRRLRCLRLLLFSQGQQLDMDGHYRPNHLHRPSTWSFTSTDLYWQRLWDLYFFYFFKSFSCGVFCAWQSSRYLGFLLHWEVLALVTLNDC